LAANSSENVDVSTFAFVFAGFLLSFPNRATFAAGDASGNVAALAASVSLAPALYHHHRLFVFMQGHTGTIHNVIHNRHDLVSWLKNLKERVYCLLSKGRSRKMTITGPY
jgi:hypothetical protein